MNQGRLRFLFAKKKGRWPIGSWILMKSENIGFSHCAIEIDGYVYESVWPKSRALFLDEWLKKYEIVYQKVVEKDELQIDEIRNDIQKNLMGKRYSIGQLILIGVGFIWDDFQASTQAKDWNGSRRLICTELLAIIANKYFGVEFNEKLDTISLSEALEKIGEL